MEDCLSKELYLGCECTDLNHISCFSYFPLTEEEKKEGENEVIYLTIKLNNYFNRIFPNLKYIFTKNEWKGFFYYNFLYRIKIGLKNVFDLCYYKEYGIFHSVVYKNEDLNNLYSFLSQIGKTENPNTINCCWLGDDYNKWSIRFYTEREIKNDPQTQYKLFFEIQFPQYISLWKRIKNSLRYIFGVYCDQEEFEINKLFAERLKTMIKWISETNEKEELNNGTNN